MHRLQSWMEKLESDFKTAWMVQFIKFGLVGVTNTILSYSVYSILIWLSVHYILASIVAFIVSVAWSYMFNNRFVFKKAANEDRIWWRILLKTYASYAITGLVINNIMLYVWVDVLKINEYLAYLINLGITVPLNFILNKFWAFRRRIEESREDA